MKLTERLWAKVTAFILTIVLLALCVGCAMGAYAMVELEMYTTPEDQFRQDVLEDLIREDVLTVVNRLIEGQDTAALLENRNIASISLIYSEDPDRPWQYTANKTAQSREYTLTVYVNQTDYGYRYWASNWESWENGVKPAGHVDAVVRLADQMTVQDTYFLVDRLITLAYALRYWIYAVAALAAIGAVACFVFLMCASGRRKGMEGPQPGWGTKVPLDMLVLICGLAVAVGGTVAFEQWRGSDFTMIIVSCLFCLECVVVALGFCMSFALRLKLGQWWKNTVVYWCLCLAGRVLKKLGDLLRSLGRLLKKVPLVWKTAVVFGVVCFADLIAMIVAMNEGDVAVFLWFLKTLTLFAGVTYAALMLRRLYAGSQALARGDLAAQVDTGRMVWDFKSAAENLNNISRGMSLAVEARTNSERMKTELITNVSHDIKTPLTSIINYSDLICREPAGSEAIGEYAQVLHRQSERLKRLIDDLVEASKASTGNIEVDLAPFGLNVLMTQCAGEYMQRMEQAGLELVTRLPEEELLILADGRRLWRVFDNLLNNACKYAAPGTRVYMTLEKRENFAVVAVKNTSRKALNISPEELMERFVRGDASRNTEGSGLGLSIARSLTELQNGTLNLSIDGDFFKAELRFPRISK